MLPPPDGGPRGGMIPHRPGLRPTGPPEQRGPRPLMMTILERPPGLGGPRPDGPRQEPPDQSRQPPPDDEKDEPKETKLPSALEKVLAFKDIRAQEVGLTPEELEQLDRPEGTLLSQNSK